MEIEPLVGAFTQDTFIARVCNAVEVALGKAVDAQLLDLFKALPFRVSKLKELNELASGRGGACLSTKFLTFDSKYSWRCADGHEWSADLNSIKTFGRWCPVCAKAGRDAERTKAFYDALTAMAEDKGGRVVSEQYVAQHVPMSFECAKGHIWSAVPQSIRRGVWCPYCGGTHLENPIDELRELAAVHGGVLLGTAYKNRRTPLSFKCANGHTFERTAQQLKHDKSWCQYCSGKLAVADEQKLAAARLSDAQWEAIRCHVERGGPNPRYGVGNLFSMRDVVDGVRVKYLSGCRWTSLPPTLPPTQRLLSFHWRWKKEGILDHLLIDLGTDTGDTEEAPSSALGAEIQPSTG